MHRQILGCADIGSTICYRCRILIPFLKYGSTRLDEHVHIILSCFYTFYLIEVTGVPDNVTFESAYHARLSGTPSRCSSSHGLKYTCKNEGCMLEQQVLRDEANNPICCKECIIITTRNPPLKNLSLSRHPSSHSNKECEVYKKGICDASDVRILMALEALCRERWCIHGVSQIQTPMNYGAGSKMVLQF